ncbi:MAG: N-acetylmuramoyl-L-alanine amidase [Alphaproteobacteria bacterium]|nr:N-acetylmuramoyl-L-alanine amidase [Alphaproteobacteria bacterium]MCW5740044.1 N-acetylmuramoyl-L-alanine amidase [Alphaproteobacteria bacterium]
MAMYPARNGTILMTEPGSTRPNGNGEVVRIVMHQTWAPQSNTNQAQSNVNYWTAETRAARKANPSSQFGVSAHFTVESTGQIIQHVDTKDGAMSTGAFNTQAVHIEFASQNDPLTLQQLHAGAELMAWIQKEHPAVRLVPVGTSNKDPGDRHQRGITGHSFVEIVGKKHGLLMKRPPNDPKTTCPGPAIIAQMNTIAVLASVRRALM